MKKREYTTFEYKIYLHYYATISGLNNFVLREKVENLKVVSYENIAGKCCNHIAHEMDYFMNTKSKQYSKGNLFDEWLWKYPHLK